MNMNKSKKRERVFHSMMEVDKEFFPASFGKKMKKPLTDKHALGVSMAKETMNKIKKELRIN